MQREDQGRDLFQDRECRDMLVIGRAKLEETEELKMKNRDD